MKAMICDNCRTVYQTVSVTVARGTARKVTVHRLVADAFHGPRPAGLQIRHLDGNKSNNAANNLQYGTASENMQDQIRHGTQKEARKTMCPYGHPLDGVQKGRRHCKTCNRDRMRRKYWEGRAA